MLQSMSDKVKGWFAGVLIVVIALAFILFSVSYYFESHSSGGGVAVKVGSVEITQQAIGNQVKQLQRDPRFASMDSAKLQQLVMNQMIHDAIATNGANKLGLLVTDSQLYATIQNNKEFMRNGVFSPQVYQQALYANGLTEEAYQARMRGYLLQNQLVSIFGSGIIPDFQVATVAKLREQTRDIAFLELKPSLFVNNDFVPTDKQISDYYAAHKSNFMQDARVKLNYLLVSPASVKKTIKLPDAELEQYYKDNITAYKEPARWKYISVSAPYTGDAGGKSYIDTENKLKKLAKSIKSSNDFASVAKTQGYTATTARWVSAADVSPAMLSILTNMSASKVSAPFASGNAIQLVYVLDSSKAVQQSFTDVKSKIEKELLSQKLNTKLSQVSEQLSDLTYTNPDSLQPASKAVGVAVQISPWVSKDLAQDKNINAIFLEPNVIKAAFSDDVMQNGNNSNVLTLKDGSLLVIRVASHQDKQLLSLDKVKNKIIENIKLSDSLKDMQKFIVGLQSKVQEGNMAEGLLKPMSLSWKVVNGLTVSDKRIPSYLSIQAFVMRPSVAPDKSVVSVKMPDGGDAVLVLNAIHDSNQDLSASQRDDLRSALVQQRASDLLALYHRELQLVTKVKKSGK